MTEILNETDYAIDESEFVALADFVLTQMHVSTSVELNIIFIDPEPMEELHIKWLDLPGPTDVMSFPMDELRPGNPNKPTQGCMGDIVICPQVAEAQAADAGHTPVEEMLLLATHGMLHLLGYDHHEPAEKEEMFTLQRTLLLTFLANR